MDVWIVTMVAMYDHGCGGVFTSEDAAREHAQALADDSDGHHDFRIERLRLDAPVWLDGRWPSHSPRYGEWARKRQPEVYVRDTPETE